MNAASLSYTHMSKDKTSLLLHLSICLLVLVLLVRLVSTLAVVAPSAEWAKYLISAAAEPDEKDPPSGDVDYLLWTLPLFAPLTPPLFIHKLYASFCLSWPVRLSTTWSTAIFSKTVKLNKIN